MNEGAVAIIDCLGFKGIWQRTDPDVVLKELGTIRNSAQQALQEGFFLFQRKQGLRIRVSFLSDTVAIGVDAKEQVALSDSDKGRLLNAALTVAQKIASDFLRMSQPLTVRGCVVFGKFDFQDSFLIGPAVDTAAELHELANGAFIWMHPDFDRFTAAMNSEMRQRIANIEKHMNVMEVIAGLVQNFAAPDKHTAFMAALENSDPREIDRFVMVIKKLLARQANCTNCLRYDVPLKGGERINAWVATPIQPFMEPAEHWARIQTAMKGGGIDVTIKLQHTARLIHRANQENERMKSEWLDALKEVNVEFTATMIAEINKANEVQNRRKQ